MAVGILPAQGALAKWSRTEGAQSGQFGAGHWLSGTIEPSPSVVAEGNAKIAYKASVARSETWVGVYKKGASPDKDKRVGWRKAPDKSGSLSFPKLTAGEYDVHLLTVIDGKDYQQIAKPASLTVLSGTLSAAKPEFTPNESVKFNYTASQGRGSTWVGVYKRGVPVGSVRSLRDPAASATRGSVSASGLPEGTYDAYLIAHSDETYYIPLTGPVHFSVKDTKQADLSLSGTRVSGPSWKKDNGWGNVFTYTVTNPDTKHPADRTTLTVDLAGSFAKVQGSVDGGASCTASGTKLTCPVGAIPASGTRKATVKVKLKDDDLATPKLNATLTSAKRSAEHNTIPPERWSLPKPEVFGCTTKWTSRAGYWHWKLPDDYPPSMEAVVFNGETSRSQKEASRKPASVGSSDWMNAGGDQTYQTFFSVGTEMSQGSAQTHLYPGAFFNIVCHIL
ncbi:hypothetical protein ACFP1Z_30645 [Streptomyces gamaensis]|uniref:Uncharacterized protein n=1 Tax=Streptomyces gamaensis TaxID=1763542 RepID=A0ABW0Z9I5_9ACTN